MIQKPLTFSANQLIIDGKDPFDVNDFDVIKENKEIFETQTVTNEGEATVLSVQKSIKNTEQERFVFVSFEEGEKYPYPDIVINTKDLSELSNPRTSDQIELGEQYFILVDTEKQRIFISNQNYKRKIEQWLSKKIKKNVTIKPLVVESDFIEKIEALNEISLTIEPVSQVSDGYTLADALNRDVNGYGAERAKLSLSYNKKNSLTDKMKEALQKIWSQKKQFKNITISGRMVDGFEAVFNTSEIVNKITINPSCEDDTMKFNRGDVLNSLMLNIQKRDED